MRKHAQLFRKALPYFTLVSMAFSFSSPADETQNLGDQKTGLGIVLGEPTGFTGKLWLEPHRALDMGLAFSFDNYVLVYGDYLFHFPEGFGTSTTFWRWAQPYIGLGGELIVSGTSNRVGSGYFGSNGSTTGFAVRIPFGAERMVPGAPIGVFVEIVPGIGIAPGTYGFLQGGVGARWYF